MCVFVCTESKIIFNLFQLSVFPPSSALMVQSKTPEVQLKFNSNIIKTHYPTVSQYASYKYFYTRHQSPPTHPFRLGESISGVLSQDIW